MVLRTMAEIKEEMAKYQIRDRVFDMLTTYRTAWEDGKNFVIYSTKNGKYSVKVEYQIPFEWEEVAKSEARLQLLKIIENKAFFKRKVKRLWENSSYGIAEKLAKRKKLCN